MEDIRAQLEEIMDRGPSISFHAATKGTTPKRDIGKKKGFSVDDRTKPKTQVNLSRDEDVVFQAGASLDRAAQKFGGRGGSVRRRGASCLTSRGGSSRQRSLKDT